MIITSVLRRNFKHKRVHTVYLEQFTAVWHNSVQRGAEFHQRLHDVLQMLNLLAGEEEPRAEQHVQKICVRHAKQQPVKLEHQRQNVSDPVARIVRIPRTDHQPRYLDKGTSSRLKF